MKKGFTLVELLIVVAILGILAAVGVVSYTGFMGSAKENAARANQITAFKFINASVMKCLVGDELILKYSYSLSTGELKFSSDLCSYVLSPNAPKLMSAFHYHFNSPPTCNPFGLVHSSGTCQEAFASGGPFFNLYKLGETQLYGLDDGRMVVKTKISDDETLSNTLNLNDL